MASTLDLAGTWQIRHDPQSQGLTGSWQLHPPKDGWRDIAVPGAWQSVLGMDANGVAWYRKELPADVIAWATGTARVRIRFESVATDCWVFVNGIEVGRHIGDYLPFEFDITDALKKSAGTPQLIVRVDQLHAPRPGKGVVTENGHITKGFHDVLSAQHAGIWGDVTVRRTGRVTILPGGLWVDADPVTGNVVVRGELSGPADGLSATCRILSPGYELDVEAKVEFDANTLRAKFHLEKPFRSWSPFDPFRLLAQVQLSDSKSPVGDPEICSRWFGLRSIRTGGPGNSQILLNGIPLQICGMLYWGHEPRHIAPRPSPEQVRSEFREIIARGFNCICLCMYYPPDYFYQIADEEGLIIWQEHPVWKSRMTQDCMGEYRRLFEGFLRRDRGHPSVCIVSATCEHDTFDKELGKWWWETATAMLPNCLKQIQTGFLEWTPPEQTDLYDDHVYDNCGRWVKFHEDMQARIKQLPPKPFVMGETIISNGWPDVEAMKAVGSPWWLTRGLVECAEYERDISRQIDAETLARFKSQGKKFALEHRKFQAEVLRTHPRNAGFVTNSIRDVPICRLGLMDDLDRWRMSPEEMKPWLGDMVLLLRTPGHLRGFRGGQSVKCQIGVSNFLRGNIDSEVTVKYDEVTVAAKFSVKPGEIVWRDMPVVLNVVQVPTLLTISASCGDGTNSWSIVVLPKEEAECANVADVPEYTEKEREPTFEEKGYSSGWGLPCATWSPRRQSGREIMSLVPISQRLEQKSVQVTHRLTPEIDRELHAGGRFILLAGPHAGGIDSKWINTWGVLPLIVESNAKHAVIRPGESEAVLALLLHDLLANTCRALPTDELGLADHLDPIIRLAWTHDSGVPKSFDVLASARVGAGLLVISTLDHTLAAGQWILHRMIEYARNTELKEAERELDISRFVST